MNKTYKKSDIDKYIIENKNLTGVEEKDLNELVDTAGAMIDRNDNYKATPSLIKSKKTSDDFVRSATQGPEAYFIYGGPYYGINYSYVVNEEESLDEEISPETIQDIDAFHGTKKKYSRDPREKARKYAVKDIKKHFYKAAAPGNDLEPVDKWGKHSLPYDTDFNFDLYAESEMKDMVDEIYLKKRDERGIVKKTNEQDILADKISIPDVSELKKTYEKPMVTRKLNHLLDLINKEEIAGVELAIILNHLLNNVDLTSLDDTYKELLGDKIKYTNEGEE
tara:strand:+ start:363 stop:1199 length:837 start_codon:yes stop_codon:yes gene_type:complete